MSEGKELKFLGWANGWTKKPEEIKNCPHELQEDRSKQTRQRFWCEECGFEYFSDCSD